MSTQFKEGDRVYFSGRHDCDCINKYDSYVTKGKMGRISVIREGYKRIGVNFDGGYYRVCCSLCIDWVEKPAITTNTQTVAQDTPQPKNDKDKNEPFVLYRRHRKFSFRLDR